MTRPVAVTDTVTIHPDEVAALVHRPGPRRGRTERDGRLPDATLVHLRSGATLTVPRRIADVTAALWPTSRPADLDTAPDRPQPGTIPT